MASTLTNTKKHRTASPLSDFMISSSRGELLSSSGYNVQVASSNQTNSKPGTVAETWIDIETCTINRGLTLVRSVEPRSRIPTTLKLVVLREGRGPGARRLTLKDSQLKIAI